MLLDIAMLIAGLVLLVIAGDYLVKGAAGLAENLGIPSLIIGLTIVAFGTSAPELFISLQSAFSGVPDIAVGNVVGSNIANVLLVMGLPALFAPVHTNHRGSARNAAVMLAFTVALMWTMNDGVLSRTEAAVLLAALLVFIAVQIIRARTAMDEDDKPDDYHEELGEMPHSSTRIALSLGAGLIGLPIAAHFTVSGASGIATEFGVSDAAIGLTIVAIGTSLPELATSLMAALRNKADVALGNVIGSNIFNIGTIMGITGIAIPLPISPVMAEYDSWVMLGCALLLTALCYSRVTVGRTIAVSMLIAYCAYIVSVF